MPFRVHQIDHVELYVPDRHAAAAWYRDVLGLEILDAYADWAENPDGPLMISPDGGSTKLALFTGEPRGDRPTAGFHLVAFRTDAAGLLDFLDRLDHGTLVLRDAEGRPVSSADLRDHAHAWSLYFCDPWGHRLELTTYDHDAVVAARQPHGRG
jgi:catechol 2,3-dioxygenase-like lactoylglutathione lyase family enzyme